MGNDAHHSAAPAAQRIRPFLRSLLACGALLAIGQSDRAFGQRNDDSFDYFRPFITEHERHAAEYAGGSDEAGVNVLDLGTDRHHSVFGYHFFHPLITEHAYIERSVEPRYVRTWNAEGKTRDNDAIPVEVFWALNNRMSVNFAIPYQFLNPDDSPNVAGFGDLEVGFQMVALNTERSIVSFALNAETPTGNAARGLGEGRTNLEPAAFWLYDLGAGNVLQTQVALELPLGTDEDVDNACSFNFAFGHTILDTVDWETFSSVTPFLELNGNTILNGEEAGWTAVKLTPGLFWKLSHFDEFSMGCSFSITGNREHDTQFLIGYFHHF